MGFILSRKLISFSAKLTTAFLLMGTVVMAQPSVEYPNKSTVLEKHEEMSETGTMVGKWKEFAGEVYSSSDVGVKFSSMVSSGSGFKQDVNLTASPGSQFTQVATDVKTISCIWKLRLTPNPRGYRIPGGYGKGWMWIDM